MRAQDDHTEIQGSHPACSEVQAAKALCLGLGKYNVSYSHEGTYVEYRNPVDQITTSQTAVILCSLPSR